MDGMNTWSRVRKMVVVLSIAGMMTWVMFKLAETNSQYLQLAIAPYCLGMVALAFAYVSDSVLRIVAERLPLPERVKAMLK